MEGQKEKASHDISPVHSVHLADIITSCKDFNLTDIHLIAGQWKLDNDVTERCNVERATE